jgi:tRNA pseudouridine55 synthase
VDNPPIRVEVSVFELTKFQEPDSSTIGFHVVCGGGTYVRSLAHDLGQRLGCGAHLTSLRRLRSGEFDIVQAVAMKSASALDVTPLEQLFLYWPCLIVSGLEERRVRKGNPIPAAGSAGFVRILNKQGEFLAIAAVESGWARPRVVLTSTTSVDAGGASLHPAETSL